MKKTRNKHYTNEKGGAMLITTILILVMMVIVGSAMNVAGMQWDMVYLQKNTSNTYYLAKSGVEKGVDVINKALLAQMPTFLNELREEYLEPLTDQAAVRMSGQNSEFYYSTTDEYKKKLQYSEDKFLLDKEVVAKVLREKIYDFLEKNYFDQKIEYETQGDGQTDINVAQISILFKAPDASDTSKSQFTIIATAQTKDKKELKKAEAVVEIAMPKEKATPIGSPSKEIIDNEIHEVYDWLYNPAEVLDSAITCFSDVVVTDGAKLTVEGDLRVKGSSKQTQIVGSMLQVPDIDENGGIIASNGGQIEVNTGNIYCMYNVATTHGWAPEDPSDPYSNSDKENYKITTRDASMITVAGDIIAHTLAIFDDFYDAGYRRTTEDVDRFITGNKIEASGNVFVDNDVRIDKYVKQSTINIAGSIFGISDGTLGAGGTTYRDPNSSSGIFNRGEDSKIQANGMFVNGQPYITFGSGYFHALWESIGQPFEEVLRFSAYQNDTSHTEGDPSYLESSAPLYSDIKKEQVTIGDTNKIYTPQDTYVSANNQSINTYTNAHLTSKDRALDFFYRGGSSQVTVQDLTGKAQDASYDLIPHMFSNTDLYYQAVYQNADGSERMPQAYEYYKNYIVASNPTERNAIEEIIKNYRGLRGYMTARRSVFYGLFGAVAPELLNFTHVIDLSLLPSENNWSYETPIHILKGDEGSEIAIDINKYYVTDDQGTRPYPTIIINQSLATLVIKDSNNSDDKKEFKGIIISEGNVKLEGELELEGALIIGGRDHSAYTDAKVRDQIMLGKNVGLSLSGIGTNVTIKHNPDILLQMNVADKKLFRSILDALKITQFNSAKTKDGIKAVADILGPYTPDPPEPPEPPDPIYYTQGRVQLSKDSILEVKTQDIQVKIKTMKKINS